MYLQKSTQNSTKDGMVTEPEKEEIPKKRFESGYFEIFYAEFSGDQEYLCK